MSKQLTAVEFLFIQLYEKFEMKGDGRLMDEILEQAKHMEYGQIVEAYNVGTWNKNEKYKNGKEYYNKTYGKETNSR